MAALEIIAPQPLSETRGISEYVCELFRIATVNDGWTWQTKTSDGKTATRWKSRYSKAPEGAASWAKYRWLPEKPAHANYCYPVSLSLMNAIKDADGVLYIVGGEIALMSMMSAGFLNTTCTFGDSTIPASIKDDFLKWGVKTLRVIPDRDDSGLKWALNIRNALKDQLTITVETLALPYELVKSHGSDVNDFWLDNDAEAFTFAEKIKALPVWVLPEPAAPAPKLMETFSVGESVNLPHGFIRDIERALGVEGSYQVDGWSRKPVRCPFHDDTHPSAYWNHEVAVLKCFSGCGTSYNAKTTGEQLGLRLRDYLDSTPTLKVVTRETVLVEDTEATTAKTPVVAAPKKQLRPPLPEFAQLTPEQEVLANTGRKWLDGYLTWTKQSCALAPEIFHEAMALWLLATIATRRIKIAIGGQEIYPNLYVLVIAKTSLYRKSTAMGKAKEALKAAGLESLLLPTDVTPEALFDELAGVQPVNFNSMSAEDRREWLLGRAVAAQRSFMKDECSSIFANLKKDYNAGLTELLLEGYQGDGGKLKKLLKSKGLVSVKDMCLSFLGATTPVMYSKYITNEETENGFIARFAIVTPEGIPVYEVLDDPPPMPPHLVSQLRHMFTNVLPWHNDEKPRASEAFGDVVTPPVMNASAAPEALKQLGEYRKALNYDMLLNDVEEAKNAAYTRLATMAAKVALLLAAIDTSSGTVRIEEQHVYAAQIICERWRESLYRLDRDVARSAESANEKVMNYLKSMGSTGATIRDVMRDCAIKQRGYLEDVLKVLAEDGVLEKFEYKPDGAGRPSIRFRYIQK